MKVHAKPNGRPPRHGVQQRARQFGLVRVGNSAAEHRLDMRTRRALARLQRQLDTMPLEAVRNGLIGSISRGRLLGEQADAVLLAAPDLRAEAALAKFAGYIHSRVRRDAEMLLLLEQRIAASAHRLPDLQTYLAAREQTATVDTPPANRITPPANRNES